MEGVIAHYLSVLKYFLCIITRTEVYHKKGGPAKGRCADFYSRAEVSSGEERNAGAEFYAGENLNARAEKILDVYGNSVLRLAYSYLHNYYDAEEILQEVLIRFLTNAPEFENPAHEKAWLMQVAANLSRNRIRYNQVRDTDELDESLIQEEREDLAFVWEAVKKLPQKYREVIHLFYYEGYSTGQIARILQRKESSVRSELSRGRARLKTVLQEACDFE